MGCTSSAMKAAISNTTS